jgi:hypothetical protein
MRALVIANGPSLTETDVSLARGLDCLTIAINDAYRLAPWADILYAADLPWWDAYRSKITFDGELWTCNDYAAAKHGLFHIPVRMDQKWSTDPNWIASGSNSGFQGINLAGILGAKEIILLGFDYGSEPGKPKHWFGDHPGEMNKNSNYRKWLERITRAAPEIEKAGINVINATRETAITCFPKQPLEALL